MHDVAQQIIRIVLSAAGGAAVGAAGTFFAGVLLRRRERTYSVSRGKKLLFIPGAAVIGGVIGACTEGVPRPICGLLLLGVLITVSLTDWLHRIIPNETVLAILLLALAFGIPTLCGAQQFLYFDIVQSLIGLVVCFVVFAIPGLFGKKVGAGDVKLAAAVGFFLGINYALLAIAIMGLLVIVWGVLQRQMPVLAYLKSSIPMGPFIAVGLLASFILSNALPIL